jgi:uncharacterized protein YkwD
MKTVLKKGFEGIKVVVSGIAVLAALAAGGYWYVHTNLVADPTSKPSCSVNPSEMISLINNYRTQHSVGEVVESPALDKVAQNMSTNDAQTNSMTLTVAAFTQAVNEASYTSSTPTFQIFPSTDSTVNGYIFKEMTNESAYKTGLLDPNIGIIGVYTNCSTNERTVTIHSNVGSEASVNGQQIKVNSLVYLVYDK